VTRTCIPDLRRHDRSDDPIPEEDSRLARLHESKTNIVIKGERADFDSLRVPQEPGASRESVATVDERHPAGSLSPKIRAPARTNDPACRILRVVSRLLGNLDAAPSATAVRPDTTRKVGNRHARPVDPRELKSDETKPKSQRRKVLTR